MANVVPVTDALYDMSREIATMEAEIYELKQKVGMTQEVKGVLDSWVRYENSLREKEQSDLVKKVMEGVSSQMKDPKMVIIKILLFFSHPNLFYSIMKLWLKLLLMSERLRNLLRIILDEIKRKYISRF